MKLVQVDTRNGMVIIAVEDDRGQHELELSTIDAASLMDALRLAIEDAIGHPSAGSMALPGMERVQIVETAEELFLRIYMNNHVSHDYPVPKGTNLSEELKLLADRLEARNMAKATHLPPDSPSDRKPQ